MSKPWWILEFSAYETNMDVIAVGADELTPTEYDVEMWSVDNSSIDDLPMPDVIIDIEE